MVFYSGENAMFSEKYQAEFNAAWRVAGSFQKGATIPWSVIESAIGRHRDEVGGRHIINRLRRRMLRDREITTLPDVMVGLRLLTDMEAATEIPTLRQKKARRQINRGLRETSAVDTSQLTRHAAESLAMARRHMKAERLAISRARRAVEGLTRPTRSVMSK
jgi:hypothetical protein